MLSSIRNRLIIIVLLMIWAAYSLWPKDVTIRSRGPDGQMRDEVVRQVPLKLGLDLQGGIHLALEVDESRGEVVNRADALDRALTVIRSRIDEFGVSEPVVQKVGDERLVVELPGLDDPARAKEIVQRSAYLQFRITDMQQQFRAAIPAIDRALRRAGVAAAPGAPTPTVPSPVEQLLGADTARDGPDENDTLLTQAGALSTLLFQGSVPGEFLVPEESFPRVDSLIRLPEVDREIPRGLQLLWGTEPVSQAARAYRPLYAVERRSIIEGDQLSDAQANLDQLTRQAIVRFDLTRAGGRIFGRETARNVGNHMAIVLDGRVQGTPPVIRSQINRSGQIELGSATLRQAQDLALVLRAGALPAPLMIVEERGVGPTLGRDAIEKGIRAAIIGGALIIVFVALYYRLAGLLAVGALSIYALLTLGGLASLGATLTLPGLAGFILSIGMAVDANVLIFERIREELAQNKSVRIAVDGGFQNAMSAIIDSNLTTVITALFLFQFGTGPVRGFATTLIIGIFASFITAVFITKTFFLIWVDRRSPEKEFAI